MCNNTPIHNFTWGEKKNILNVPALNHVMFLRKYKERLFLWTQFLQKVCFLPIEDLKSDELCSLRQISVS